MKVVVELPTVVTQSTPGHADGVVSVGLTISGISNTALASSLLQQVKSVVGANTLALMQFAVSLYSQLSKVK